MHIKLVQVGTNTGIMYRPLISCFGDDSKLPILKQWKFAVYLSQTLTEEENSKGSK